MVLEEESLKAIYRQVTDADSASYQVWLRKFHRLAKGNKRTVNATARRLGIEPLPVTRQPRPTKRPTSQARFVTYDGEGFGNRYILLANNLGESISNVNGLSTKECLDFLTARYEIRAIRTFFSFGYDINHVLRDVPDDLLMKLLEGRLIDYEGYRLQYIPGKIFTVNNIRYYDVFGFFQTSFLNVVKLMLGESAVSDKLIEGKEARGTFETWPMEKIIEYNAEELDLLEQILNKLRESLEAIDVHLREWYGPGAIAKYWFRQHSVNAHERYDAHTLHALGAAYFGGRFEQITLGTVSPVYEYDIRSAYPSVMATMPYFTGWTKTQKYRDTTYSIWHVTFDFREDSKDGSKPFLPLPMRSRDGRICFPLVGRGWYWNNELQVAIQNFPNAKFTFHGGYVATTEPSPFGWIADAYRYRAELKRSGNLAHYAIKVGLNSLYGKCAQRVGKNAYFSLAWAGFITSTTRAKLADAGYRNPTAVVGFATDALFTTQPLTELSISDELGSWEESHFDSGTFFQSGVYRLVQSDKTTIDRYRGAPLRRGIDDIVTQLNETPLDYPVVKIGRFIGHLLALRAPNAYSQHRLSFVQVPFRLQLDAPIKRHYVGFLELGSDGHFRPNYRRLLTRPIYSLPKVWVDDVYPAFHEDYLNGLRTFKNVESYPPPMKDNVLQRLIEEGIVIASEDGNYNELAQLLELPIVEEELM